MLKFNNNKKIGGGGYLLKPCSDSILRSLKLFGLNCFPNPTSHSHSELVSGAETKRQTNRLRNEFGMTHNKAAFTLAEVLITLGIIGVVAAITIPNLIAAHQKKAAVTGIIAAQSILNQAVKMYAQDTDEEGSNEFDTTLSTKDFAEKYFKPYLKVAQVCTKMSDGCWKTANFYGYYDLSGKKQTETVPYSLVLNNGMILGFNKIDGTNLISILVDINGRGGRNVLGKDIFVFYTYNNANLCDYGFEKWKNVKKTNLISILVDINGRGGRNVLGKDIFVFYTYNNANLCDYGFEKWKNVKNGIYPGGFDNCGAPHVAYSREELMAPSKVLRSCNKLGSHSGDGQGKRTGPGTACAAVIYKDGWKISSDYPWN